MQADIDYKPLEKLVLPVLGEVQCTGLIVIVGPNSSGKSQLLQDIYLRICGEPRPLVVAKEVRIRPIDFEPFIDYLERKGYLEKIIDVNGAEQLRPLTMYVGSGQAMPALQPAQARDFYASHEARNDATKHRSGFLNHFGRILVSGLFLERRLVGLGQVNTVDLQLQPPQHELHSLCLDDTASRRLFDETRKSFGKAVWPDFTRGTVVCLRVSDEGKEPSAEDRLSPTKMAAYRQIESEGDGLKSYVATCVSLMLGRRPVSLIDEPEICLHPPQAYNLGRFIGEVGANTSSVTFVSTHSSQILRGIVQSTKSIQIIRLSRQQQDFVAHHVSPEVLEQALKKPTVRAESVLDGIFAQSVVVVEADGDRLVYQTALETLSSEMRLDIHFATVGGTGGIADTCNLYRTLKIPVAVIADLDMVSDSERLKKVLAVLGDANLVTGFVQRASEIVCKIEELSTQADLTALRNEVSALAQNNEIWQQDSEVKAQRELRKIAQQLDRRRRLKRGGISALPNQVAQPLQTLVDDLSKFGIFLVPVGELEEWLKDCNIQVSKEHKWAWANAASLVIQSRGLQTGDIWDFVRKVAAYLQPA